MPEYKNPTQGPGGDKQLFVMFAVMFVIIALFQVFANKKPPSDLGEHKAQPQQASNAAQNTPATPAPGPAQTKEAAKPTPPRAAAATAANIPAKQGSSEQQIVVENSQYRITFTNK